MSLDSQKINEQIDAPRVRLIGERGEPLGILEIKEAFKQAQQAGLDVVEVASDADPPVCKLMDFGKQKYRQKKRLHDAKKNHHSVETKEIWFRPQIDEHDKETKLVNARKFLEQGCRVALTMRFKGREKRNRSYGIRVLDDIGRSLEDFGKIEQNSVSDGAKVQMIIAPIKSNKKTSAK